MTVRTRTLAEAAAEVLSGTHSSAPAEPMHKLPNTGSGLDNVVDLGGSTFEDPQAQKTGIRTGGAATKATAPGKTGVGQEPSHGSLPDTTQQGPEDETLEGSMNKTVKPKMQPTAGGTQAEEVESDEEVIEEETDEDLEAARQARWDSIKERISKHSVKEDMAALFANSENLSEEFKDKATIIFETAVLKRAVDVVQETEAEILEAAEAAIDEVRQELEEKVEGYLNFVVEQWVAENTVAIESGLKTEVVEGFITGLKTLFAENYMEVPEDKLDVLSAQEEEIAELTNKVNEAIAANIELTKKLNESTKKEVISKVCESLTATQAEKVKTLAEGVEFVAADDYTKKLTVIRDSYIASNKVKEGSSVVALTEGAGPAEVEVEEGKRSDYMDLYTSAISRTQK